MLLVKTDKIVTLCIYVSRSATERHSTTGSTMFHFLQNYTELTFSDHSTKAEYSECREDQLSHLMVKTKKNITIGKKYKNSYQAVTAVKKKRDSRHFTSYQFFHLVLKMKKISNILKRN